MIEALTQWVDIYYQAMTVGKYKSDGKTSQPKQIVNISMLHFAQSEELCNVFVSLLKLGSQVQSIITNLVEPNSQALPEPQFISVIGITELDTALNQLSSKVLSCFKNIWLFIYKDRPKEVFQAPDKVNLYV